MMLTYPEATSLEGLLVNRGNGTRPSVTVQVQLALHRWRQRHDGHVGDCPVTKGECVEDLVEV